MKIYLASSWRNKFYEDTLAFLRGLGCEVYDFKADGFSWADIDPRWLEWTQEAYARALRHPLAVEGYARDKAAMLWADTCVLLLPSGRSASFELGYCMGKGKRGIVYMPEKCEPELMYAEAKICGNKEELKGQIRYIQDLMHVPFHKMGSYDKECAGETCMLGSCWHLEQKTAEHRSKPEGQTSSRGGTPDCKPGGAY